MRFSGCHISAVIPAAGLSSRMHSYKPLLELGGVTMLERTILLLKEFRLEECRGEFRKECRIDQIIVVTGFNHEKIEPLIVRSGAEPIFNEDYEKGMLSSIKKGISRISPDSEGFLLLPADTPLVRRSTIETLTRAFMENSCRSIVTPLFKKKPGHPPVIPTNIIPEILAIGENSTLRELLQSKEDSLKSIEVHDRGILMDADTQPAYIALQEREKRLSIPDREEAISIIETRLHGEEELIKHLELVASTALRIAEAVMKPPAETGKRAFPTESKKAEKEMGQSQTYQEKRPDLNRLDSIPSENGLEERRLEERMLEEKKLNLDLISAAALLHDICKREKHHAAAGAELLRGFGFNEVADIVAQHMNLEMPLPERLNEAQIVYFADKICSGSVLELDYASRFAKKAETMPQAAQNIMRRYENTCEIQRRIEQAAGRSLHSILF